MDPKKIAEQHQTVSSARIGGALCPSGVFRNAFRALTGFCFDPALQCPADVPRGITLLALTFIECTIWNYLPVTTGIFVLL
mgnify:FL=1